MSGYTPVGLSAADRELLLSKIRDIPNWPKPGIVFKDITPLLADHTAFSAALDALAAAGRDETGRPAVDSVAGIEARGFILGAPVAQRLGVGFVPIRKQGKLPYETRSARFALEYGEETVEVHTDAFAPGARVLLVDDVLATGGTVAATVELVAAGGANVSAIAVLIELGLLGGRDRLDGLALTALLEA